MTDKDNNSLQQSPFTRRNFLQTISLAVAGTAAAAAPALAQATNAPQPVVANISSEKQHAWKIFNEQQWRTVCVLCDLILPADEHSGSAVEAGVPEFIDDWIDFRRQQDGNDLLLAQILGGILWLDSESHRLFAAPFVDARPAQQKQILDRIAWPAHAAQDDHRWMRFFSEFRKLTVIGFYSSKLGVADLNYLGNTVVDKWTGCPDEIWKILEERSKSGYQGIRLQPSAKADRRSLIKN